MQNKRKHKTKDMSKIGLIIGREYKTRVRKKSFIVMTLLGPILFAALMVAPAQEHQEHKLRFRFR